MERVEMRENERYRDRQIDKQLNGERETQKHRGSEKHKGRERDRHREMTLRKYTKYSNS